MASKAKSADGDASTEKAQEPVWDGKPVRITLLHGRGRHLGWVLFGGIGGGVLLLTFGVIGQVIGAGLVLIALQQAYRLVQTVTREPGTFRVDGEDVAIPTGLCSGTTLTLQRKEIDHVYFLRRAVPWTQAGPLLIVETGGNSYGFPRDWFASDSDQRRVEMALNRQLKLDAAA